MTIVCYTTDSRYGRITLVTGQTPAKGKLSECLLFRAHLSRESISPWIIIQSLVIKCKPFYPFHGVRRFASTFGYEEMLEQGNHL